MPSVTRTHHRSRPRRREEILAALLQAVEELLAEATFTELSVGRIVRAAGISRSTFYVYFEDKGDLLEALTEDVMSELIDAAAQWWALPPEATKADVREMLAGIVEVYRRHRLLMGAVIETTSYDDGVRRRFGEMMARSIAGVAEHLRAGQAQGSVTAGIDADRVAAWTTWMTERGLSTLVAGAPDAEVRRLLDGLTEIVWNVFYEGTR